MPFFPGSNIDEKTFSSIDLSSQNFEGVTFRHCTFSDCNLSETIFTACFIKNCRFINCDLSLIRTPKTCFQKTFFKDSRMMGINWCIANWEAYSLISKKRVDFENCLLDHSLFINLDLSETQFLNCKAHHVDFEGANLTKANFRGTDLEGTRFMNCDLSETDFAGAINYTIDAGQNKLHKTRFSLPEAIALLHALDIVLEDLD